MSRKSKSCFRQHPLSAAICTLVAAPFFVSEPVVAQGQGMLEEVIVSARKRDEALTEVPVSISAMSGEALDSAGVTNLTELFALSPGVENNADGSRIANKPTIRGVGTTENAAIRSKVTSFIDGTPVLGAQGIGSFGGLERVEILRGPQSAAFGRATFGGAINYVTKNPGEELELSVRATAGNDETYNLGVSVAAPLIEGKLGVAITLEEKNYGGDDDWKTTSGVQLGEQNDQLGSIKLAFAPTDKLSGTLMYMRQEVDDSESPLVLARTDTLEPWSENASGTCGLPGGAPSPNSCVTNGSIARPSNEVFDYDYDNAGNPILDPGTRIERDRYQGSLVYDFDNGLSLTAVVSHSEEEGETWFDRDTLAGGMSIHAASTPVSEDDYAEVRLASSGDDKFSWLIGASIYEYDYVNTVFANKTAGVVMDIFSESAENTGLFFNLGYEVSDRLTASLEGRYQKDKISGTLPANTTDVPVALTQTETTNSFQPRFALNYMLNEEMNVYAQIAKGNNPAGFNTNALDPGLLAAAAEEGFDLPSFQTFEEEEILNYEVGVKVEDPENGLRYSVAVYYLDWEGYVSPATANWTPADGILLPGATANDYFTRLFFNTGDLDGFGLEIEGQWAPSAQWVFGGAFSASGLEFSDGSCSPIPISYGAAPDSTDPYPCADVGGKKTPGVSQTTFSLNATYTFQVSDSWEGYARADYQWRSKRYVEQINTDYIPSYDIVDLRIGARNDNWSVELYGKNLTDDDTPSGAVRFFDNRLPGMVFNTTYQVRRPISYGIRLSYDL